MEKEFELSRILIYLIVGNLQSSLVSILRACDFIYFEIRFTKKKKIDIIEFRNVISVIE